MVVVGVAVAVGVMVGVAVAVGVGIGVVVAVGVGVVVVVGVVVGIGVAVVVVVAVVVAVGVVVGMSTDRWQITTRVNPEVIKYLVEQAERAGVSLSQTVELFLSRAVAEGWELDPRIAPAVRTPTSLERQVRRELIDAAEQVQPGPALAKIQQRTRGQQP